MDSMLFSRQHSFSGSEVSRNEEDSGSNYYKSGIPTWKVPLSKSYTAGLYDQKHAISPVDEESSSYAGSGRVSTAEVRNSQDQDDLDDPLIQILLPCIICNRTFSPAALERHSKVCTKVNVVEKRQPRPTYDSHAQRIKNTRVADFIPPPPEPAEPDWLSRNSRFRRSLQGSFSRGSGPPRSRAASTPKTLHYESTSDTYGGGGSDFGSSEDSGHNENGGHLPAYARALSPAENCPYCLRSFGLKAYDRHVSFCRDVWERKQFEIQPTPKELEEARERQEIRTKYKPLKGSTSCTSLRSGSPPKDPYTNFATAALNKLFGGLRRTERTNDLYNRTNFQKSSESLASSCYGDFTRSMSLRRGPSPGRRPTGIPTKVPSPMRPNNSSNLVGKPPGAGSTESLGRASNVPSSGYGQGGNYMSNFSRNSKMRSSLGKNFFRSKRVEPDGHENAPTPAHNPLIITPMSFYSKGGYGPKEPARESSKKANLLSGDPKYDPYEKAARQLEELLKTQPFPGARSNTQRKVGVDRALASVLGSGDKPAGRKSARYLEPEPAEEFNFDLEQFTADESYWDEIMGKESGGEDKAKGQRNSETERRGQRSSDILDPEEPKTRTVSNVSSADSAFSRSDGGTTDQEFEALESLMNAGTRPNRPQRSASSSLLAPPIRLRRAPEDEPRTNRRASSDLFGRLSGNGGNTEPKVSNEPDPEDEAEFSPGYAKFCHECGTSFPTSAAKFCPECGERRVVNV